MRYCAQHKGGGRIKLQWRGNNSVSAGNLSQYGLQRRVRRRFKPGFALVRRPSQLDMIQIDERGLAELNRLEEENLTAELLRLCGSMRWAQTVAHAAPFHDKASLTQLMDKVWWSLDPADWLEAFAAHPRIGDKEELRKKFAAAAASGGRGGDLGSGASGGGGKPWEAEEQSGASGASEETLNALQEWNGRYEDKYGHIFLVCATGKTADEMLRLLKERMANDKDSELRVAAGEQSKITHLRLQKLLQALSHDGAEHDGSSRL